MSKLFRPIVAVTMGDAAGISPEVVVQALSKREVRENCRPLVIGDAQVLRRAVEVTGCTLEFADADEFEKLDFSTNTSEIPVLQNDETTVGQFEPGQVQEHCGRAFVAAIQWSARLALENKVHAIASAPTNKESMQAAGHRYSGQTDIYAEAAGISKYFTILTGGNLRLFLLSSHVSLAEAIRLVTLERVLEIAGIADVALRDLWGIANPRIAVAGLNPHAGDGGLFGREEIEEVAPAIRQLRETGKQVVGPFPADSLLYRAESGEYDGVVVMYHDQGVIPLKRYGYVTVIAGTPFIRTTAGHGTAYDIAWKGRADGAVMARAIQVATELALARA